MKKVFIILGSVLGLLVAAAVIVPLVVDVDKYRPMIVSKAGEHINGKLEIGKLTLSLWGRVLVKIDGLKLSDAKGNAIVAVKDASVNIPFGGLLSGAPEFQLQMNAPAINVIKHRDGKMNVMTLMKEEKPAAGAAPGTTQSGAPAAPQAAGKTEIPAIAMKARLTFLVDNAKFGYKDELTGDSYGVNDLDISIRNVSMEREMPFEIVANLDVLSQKKITVKGPLVFSGSVKPILANGSFDKAEANATLKMDGVEILYPGMFDKKPGVPLGFEMKATVGKDSAQVPTMRFKLADVVIDSNLSTKTVNQMMNVDFKLTTNQIDIAKLGGLISMIKEYGMNGTVNLKCEAHGPAATLDYSADIAFKDIKLMHESLKQPIEMGGSIAVVTNKLKDLTVKMNAKDFDVTVNGMVENFLAPRFKFTMNSNKMDLDGLLKASEKAAQARKEEAAQVASGKSAASGAAAKPIVDYNAMFKPMRENPMLAGVNGTFDVNLKWIKSTGVVIDNFKAQYIQAGLLMKVNDLSMGLFGGSIKGMMSFDAKPEKPDTAMKLTIASLSTQKMVESHFPFARNTVRGIISANMSIGGKGVNPDDITSAWKGEGGMDIKNATLTTFDIGPELKKNVFEKLPDAAKSKAKFPPALEKWKGEYDTIVMKWALKDGVFFINEIKGKAYPSRGMDMYGGGTIKLKDYAQDLGLDLVDQYNLMDLEKYARDKKYNKFTLSPAVGCSALAPCFKWEKTIGKLAQAAASGMIAEKVAGKLPPKAAEALNKVLGGGSGGGSAPAAPKAEEVKNKLKGLFGR